MPYSTLLGVGDLSLVTFNTVTHLSTKLLIGRITLKRALSYTPQPEFAYLHVFIINKHPNRPLAPSQDKYLSHIRAAVDTSRKSEWCDEAEGDRVDISV